MKIFNDIRRNQAQMRKGSSMSKLVLIVFGWFALGMPAQAASFDCGKAQSKVEHLICDNPVISKLDNELGNTYQDVISKANEEDKQRVIAEQKHWLKYTRNVCSDETCFKQAYWSRLAELETFFISQSSPYRSPPYKKEADKAEIIKQVLATSPLFLTDWSHPGSFCSRIFDDLKQMKGINFVEPIVQVQSYEDEALDPWKRGCKGKEPLNFSYRFCGKNIPPDNNKRKGRLMNCTAGYGLPPFKLFELPPSKPSGKKRFVFYSDADYGPMNGGNPKLNGGGAAGYKQIDVDECQAEAGFSVPTTRSEPNGSNVSAIIEYKRQYYILLLERTFSNAYWLSVKPGDPNYAGCVWSPVKPKSFVPTPGSN